MWPMFCVNLCLLNEKLKRKSSCSFVKSAFFFVVIMSAFCWQVGAEIYEYCNENGNSTLVYPAENVQVATITDEFLHLIKFNVSWEKPTHGSHPTGYSVSIEGLGPNCLGMHAETHFPKENDTYTVLPSDTDEQIKPDCSYRVHVKSYLNDCFPNPAVNFTVPECVGKICNCEKAFPAPNILKIVLSSADTIQVKWNITNPENILKNHNITAVKFWILLNKHVLYKQKKNISNEDLFMTHTDLLHLPEMAYMLYKLKMNLINQFNCEGSYYDKNFTGLYPQAAAHWWLSVALPIICFIMFMGFVVMATGKRCSYWCRKKMRPSSFQRACSPIKDRDIIITSSRSQSLDRRRSILSLPMNSNPIYLHSESDRYEMPYSCIEFGEEIGKGAFGHVYKAKIRGLGGFLGTTQVAVKTHKKLATTEELEEFLLEIKMLKKIGAHPNIVALLGCCTNKQPYCMLMEFVPCGDLLKYLQVLRDQYERRVCTKFLYPSSAVSLARDRNFALYRSSGSEESYIVPENIHPRSRTSSTETEYTMLCNESPRSLPHTPMVQNSLECILDPKELHNFAIQIAKGMAHLEKQQIIHRDLAARNILIDKSKVLKISDFGFSRSGIYVNKHNKKVPLRWLSTEAVRDNLYTSKSDVWAYGIVLWEIGTLGGFPYPAVSDKEVIKFILDGNVMDKPQHCTDELYELMIKCWAFFADERPSFEDIVEHFEIISNKKRVVYVDFNLIKAHLPPPNNQMEQKPDKIMKSSKTNGSVKYLEILLPDSN